VEDREDRRLSIAALRKAGYIGKQKKTTDVSGDIVASNTDQKSAVAGPSKPSTVEVLVRVQIHGEIDSSYFFYPWRIDNANEDVKEEAKA
jgi:hypothetical protein